MLRTMVRVIAMIVLACVVLTAPGPALGQPELELVPEDDTGPPAPTEAKRWLDAGDTLIKAGDKLARRGKTDDATSEYERALISYQKALELSGNPQVYFAIGAAYEKLGKRAEALLAYRRVAVEVTDKPQLVELVNRRLAALAEGVGLLIAKVEPAGAELAIDGNPVGTAPLADPLVLEPGSYRLTITATGYHPMEVTVVIDAGSESERTYSLEPVPVEFDEVKDAPSPKGRDQAAGGPSRLLLWVGAGATITLAGIATATGATAVARHDTFADGDSTAVERDRAEKSGKRLALATDLCLAGAVVAAGVTAYYYFRVYQPRARAHRKQESRPKVAVFPWVQSTTGGVAIAVTY